MRILVTGASGLIGGELSRLLIQNGHNVAAMYNTHKPRFGNPIKFDLTQAEDLHETINKISPDLIIHAAAITNLDFCEENPKTAQLINGEATGRIARAAQGVGSKLIYISTDNVFDGLSGNYDEQSEPKPINKYGQSKFLGEQLARNALEELCVVRTSVVYGWSRAHASNFATWVIMKLEAGEGVTVVKDHYCSPTLNDNLAAMIMEVIDREMRGIIHLAGATRVNRYELAVRLAEALSFDSRLITPGTRKDTKWVAKRPSDSSLNVAKAKSRLKNQPLELAEALRILRVNKTL